MSRRFVPAGRGPRTLYTLATAFRAGNQEAGWAFAMSPQMEAVITTQVGAYSRYRYVREEDLEDLRQDLRVRIMQRLAAIKMPDYHQPGLNEAALVAYFRRAIMDLAQQAMRQIIGPMKSTRTADGKRRTAPVFTGDVLSNGTPVEAVTRASTEPVEMVDRERRLRMLALAQRFFANDDEARMGFAALYHHASGLDQWEDIAQAVGLAPSQSRVTRGLAVRWRNLLKAALIENGEDVGYSVLGIYTSLAEAGVTLLSSSGSSETWTIPCITVVSPEALCNRILKALGREDSVTFATLNMDDHSSPMRMAAMRALHYREPLVEKYDIGWLESFVAENLKPFRRYPDAKRRSLLLAQAKLAECQLRYEKPPRREVMA